MKKMLMFVMLCALTVAACNTQPGEEPAKDDAAARNIAAVNAISKAFETGDFSAIRPLLADDIVDHAGPQGPVKGADSVLAGMVAMQKMAQGMKSITISLVADSAYTFQWLKVSGTMTEDGYGMKKGETFSGSSVEVARFNADGKMAEHWTFMDYAEVMKMMASTTPPPPAK